MPNKNKEVATLVTNFITLDARERHFVSEFVKNLSMRLLLPHEGQLALYLTSAQGRRAKACRAEIRLVSDRP